MAARVASGKTVQKAFSDRFTRFALYEYPGEGVSFSRKDRFVPMANGRYLDKLMSEIPGDDLFWSFTFVAGYRKKFEKLS